MPKGMVDSAVPETGLTDLRDGIRKLEISSAYLRGQGAAVLDVLNQRDVVEELMAALTAKGMDLRAEKTRVETIDNHIRRQAGVFNRELVGSGGMEAARQQRRPPDSYWWWFVDIEHAKLMRKSAIKYGSIIVGIMLVLVLVNALMTHKFGGTKAQQAAQEHTSTAERLIQLGDYAGAIAEYEAANAVSPDANSYVWLAVLYDVQGDKQRSADAVKAALELNSDGRAVYNTLADGYIMVGKVDEAEASALKALALDNYYARTWLSLGTVAEARGDSQAAIKLYDEAGRLANEQGNDALYVLARVRMGMLMGGGGGGSSGGGF